MKVTRSGETLGATIEGLDLAKPLSEADFDAVLRALGERGVVRFPRQKLTGRELADFSARFGKLEINVANAFQEPGIPEVMILSNIVENGKPIGLADAGQDWHTDMSYSSTSRSPGATASRSGRPSSRTCTPRTRAFRPK